MGTREQRMTRVTIGCAVANLLLAVAKTIAGIIGKSSAMTADAIHSLSDVVCDGMVLLMVRISGRGSDKKHNWGYGKYETVATMAVSVLLIVVAVELMTDGISSIRSILSGEISEKPGMIALWVAIISIIVQEGIFRWTVHVGKAVESQTMIANAWHHRSDALSSVGSLIGIGGAILLGGKWTMLDPLVGCIISIVILVIALKMLFPALSELTEGSMPEDEREKVEDIINTNIAPGRLKELKTRKSGAVSIIEFSYRISADTTIVEADAISDRIETLLKEEFGEGTTVTAVPEAEEQK